MGKKWLLLLFIVMFIGAAILGLGAVAAYAWYAYPNEIAAFFPAAPVQASSLPSFETGGYLANRSKSLLTPDNEDAFVETEIWQTAITQTVTVTNIDLPLATEPFSPTPTETMTATITETLTGTADHGYPSVNTAIPYVPAATAFQQIPTRTSAPYHSPTSPPELAPTHTATKIPTEAVDDLPNTPAPTATTTMSTNTAAPSPVANLTPTDTSTPVPPTQTNSGPAPTPTVDLGGCSYSNHGYYESELLGYINALRSEHGLAALSMQSQLRGAAREHSNDMACNNFVSHIGTNGTTNHDRIVAYGYTYTWRGENIYMGWKATPAVAFEWWINSQPHLDNLLNPNFIHIGIGHSVSSDRNAFTLVFARP